jgi:ABC-type branched-subunit amino acid transport system substrate-binding protein
VVGESPSPETQSSGQPASQRGWLFLGIAMLIAVGLGVGAMAVTKAGTGVNEDSRSSAADPRKDANGRDERTAGVEEITTRITDPNNEATEATEATDVTSEVAVGEPGGSGLLTGMKGTAPLGDIDKLSDFNRKLDQANGGRLLDYNYGAESYDVVNILALSAVAAGCDAPGAIAAQIVNTTRDGNKCNNFETCKAILDAGGDVDYDGASGSTDMLPNGEPAEGSYGILEFDGRDRVEVREYRTARAAEGEGADGEQPDPAAGPAADGVLRLGTVLPLTGMLDYLGPPEVAGVKLAVGEVNAAGGVLGMPVELVEGDSGDRANQAYDATVDTQISGGVDAMIGAAASGVTLAFLDRAVAAGIIVFSPANTAAGLSDYPDKGLYYRLAPSDILQGQALADLISADGHTEVAVMNLQDAYGTRLAEDFVNAFEASGGTVIPDGPIEYQAPVLNLDAEVQRVVGHSPEAIVLIGFEDSAEILKLLIAAGNGPDKVPTYGVDGNMGNALAELVHDGG